MSILDEDKIKECKIVFDMFDEDKDTKIEIKVLGDVIRVCGGAPSQQELDEIIKNYSSKGKKYVAFEEFLETLNKILMHQESEEDIINLFKKMDKKGDGTITENDLRSLMDNYENALTSEEIEDIIQEANVDENGNIDIAKFTKILLGNN